MARLLPPSDSQFWPQFLELLAKPWHNRVWTVQEACVDTSVSFIIGVHERIHLLDFMGFVSMVRAFSSDRTGFLNVVETWRPSLAAKTELVDRLASRYQKDRQEMLDETKLLSTLDQHLIDIMGPVQMIGLLLQQRLDPDTSRLRHSLFKVFYGRDCTVQSDRVAAMAGILTPSPALDASLDFTTNEAFKVASCTWWARDPELTFLHFIDPHRKSWSHPSWYLTLNSCNTMS